MATDLGAAAPGLRDAIRSMLADAAVPLSTTQIVERVGDVSREVVKKQPEPAGADLFDQIADEVFDDADERAWQESALCAQTDPEAFFPERGGSTREAKRICQGCWVRAECLEYALAHDERFGIWGGLSERERRKLKKRA